MAPMTSLSGGSRATRSPSEGDLVNAGDVVWVPFPHVEDNRLRSRPAVIVATDLAGTMGLCWGLMITSASNEAWPGDIVIADHESAGLPIASCVRTGKIATLVAASATRIGCLPEAVWREVRGLLARTLDMSIR